MKKLFLFFLFPVLIYAQEITEIDTEPISAGGAGNPGQLCELSRTETVVYYAIIYERVDSGVLETFSVDTAGTITSIDAWTFASSPDGDDAVGLKYPGQDYVLAGVRGVDSDIWVFSIPVSATGTITKSKTDSLEIASDNAAGQFALADAQNGYFAVAYRNAASRGYIKTFYCNTSGVINNTVTDNEWYDLSGLEPAMEYIGNGYLAVACSGDGSDGWMKSIAVDGSGTITSKVDSLEFDESNVYTIRMGVRGENVVLTYNKNAYGLEVSSCMFDTTDGSLSEADDFNILYESGEFGRYSTQKFCEGTDSLWTIAHRVGQLGIGDEGAYIGTYYIDPVDGSVASQWAADSLEFETGNNVNNFSFNMMQLKDKFLCAVTVAPVSNTIYAYTFKIDGTNASLTGEAGLPVDLFGISSISKVWGVAVSGLSKILGVE